MRIRVAWAAAAALLQISTASQQPPSRPFGKGVIAVQVTQVGTLEGIPDVAVTLSGPTEDATAEQVRQLFSPSPSLTVAQRREIDQMLKLGLDGEMPPEAIAYSAAFVQAQFLGQPAPPSPRTSSQPANLTLMTDSDGRVSFLSLSPGRYTIRVERDGYYGNRLSGTAEFPTSLSGKITLKESDDVPATLPFAMLRGVALGGRVRDPEGRPVAGLIVSAQQPVYSNGRTVLNTINQAQTDDRGGFRLFWLPPGDYYVSAAPRPRATAASPQDTWAKTYFPGVVDARAASQVTATEGAELNGLDFAIQAEAVGRIGGRIENPFKDKNGKPTSPSQTLYLLPVGQGGLVDKGALTFQNAAQERSNGEFEIRGALPGVYDLLVSASTGAANTTSDSVKLNDGTVLTWAFVMSESAMPSGYAWGRVRVDVDKEEPFHVTIPIKAGVEVKIRATMDGASPPYSMERPPQRGPDAAVVHALIAGGVSVNDAISAARRAPNTNAPIPTPQVRLYLQPIDNAPFSAAQASFDPSGLYVFPTVPQGSYRVQVTNLPAPEAYVAEIRMGGASIFDEGFLIDGPLPGDIEVAIVSKGSQVQGAVANVENRPAPNATVALVPAETRRQNPELYKTARTDAMGNFTFKGVAPGLYKLFAWEDAPNGAWRNADFLSRYEQLGEAVTVTGGESLKVSLKLIPKNYGR